MAERGARPKVPQGRLRPLHGLRAVFTPLLPDDYLELINPLWSTQELRGRIERIDPETADAATIVISRVTLAAALALLAPASLEA